MHVDYEFESLMRFCGTTVVRVLFILDPLVTGCTPKINHFFFWFRTIHRFFFIVFKNVRRLRKEQQRLDIRYETRTRRTPFR